MSLVNLEERGPISIIKLNNPPMNVLSMEVLSELNDVIKKVEDGDSKVVIITGEGKTLCAGANIKQMVNFSKEDGLKFGKLGQGVMFGIERSKKVYISAIHGFAFGGGCELSIACDFRVAERSAKLAQPEINIGIITGFGGTQRLPLLIGLGRAKDLLLTGRSLTGEESFNMGLVDRLAEDGHVLEEALKFANELAAMPKVALEMTKQMTDSFLKQDFEEEMKMFAHCFETKDQKEGMNAFLEKRKPNFTDE